MKARAIRLPGERFWRVNLDVTSRYLHLERVWHAGEELMVSVERYDDKKEAEQVAREIKDMEAGEWV